MAGYGDDAGLEAYALQNDVTLPSGSRSAARQRGSMFVDASYGEQFPGMPTGGALQERAWPRTGAADRYGNDLSSDTVPDRVVWASYEAAIIELRAPGSLAPSVSSGARVKRKKVDALEVEYFDDAAAAAAGLRPTLSAVDGLLKPLLVASSLPAVLVV